MRKISLFVFMLCCFSIMAVGCTSDPVKKDLTTYVNDGIRPLSAEETRINTTYESVTGDKFTDDETLYNTLKDDIIPSYRSYLTKVEAVKPETPEVREVHETMIQAINVQQSAFVIMVDALENQDYSKIDEANIRLTEGRKLVRDYQSGVEALAKKHNLTFNDK